MGQKTSLVMICVRPVEKKQHIMQFFVLTGHTMQHTQNYSDHTNVCLAGIENIEEVTS